jgi:hypothetical protein
MNKENKEPIEAISLKLHLKRAFQMYPLNEDPFGIEKPCNL